MSKSKTEELFGGMSVQTVTMIIMAILEMFMFSFWSRHLTKQDFGYMSAILGILALVEVISQAGLGSAIIQKKDASKEFVSTAFSLSILLGIGGSLLVFILSPVLARLVADETITNPLRLMSMVLLIHSMLSVANSQLTKQLRFMRLSIISVSSYVLGSVIGIVLIMNGFGLWALMCASLIVPLINLVLIYCTSISMPRFGIRKKEIKGIVNYGGWLTVGSLFNAFSQRADSLLMSRLLSVEALGAYNRPAGFVNTISTKINSVFDTVLFPLLSDIQDDQSKVKDVMLRSISILNSCSIVLAAIFFFNAELIITIFFGNQWLELVPVMRIVSLAVIFRIDGRLVDCFFRSLGLVKLGAYLRFVQGIIVVVAIVIGSRFGIIGVAVSLVLSDIIIIITKVLALTISVKVSIGDVIIKWLLAWRSILPFLVISIPYMLISHNLLINIVYAVLFTIVFVSEFIIWPKMVGGEYAVLVSPFLSKILGKLKSKIHKKNV